MKRIVLLLLVCCVPIISSSQERLQTLGAELFARVNEHPLFAKTVFLDKGPKAGYYSTYDQEGFVLDVDSLSIIYTSFEIDYSHTPILADNVSRVSLSLDKNTFNIIYDMYNLLVSTSSPENEINLINPPFYYFAHNYTIAACPNELSRIVRYSKSICEGIKEKNLEIILSIIPEIKLLNTEYKRIMRNEIHESYYSPDITIGSFIGRIFIRIHFDDNVDTDGELYNMSKSIAKRLAEYLLQITDQHVYCEIIVSNDGNWGRIEYGKRFHYIDLRFNPKDISYNNIIQAIDSFLGRL